MFKFFLTLFLGCFFGTQAVAGNTPDFYENILISKDAKLEETAIGAKGKAGNLLNKQIESIKLEGAENLPENIRPPKRNNSFQRPSARKVTPKESKYGDGPFGLPWGATYEQIKDLGVEMVKTPIKDYPNSFIATKLPKQISDITKVYITFGENNKLWRIVAYGELINDTPDASKIMQQYHQYGKLLGQKYGNEKEFFTPKISEIEKKYKDKQNKEIVKIVKVEEPIGNKNFLAQLQSGEAVLYSAYENQKVGVVLSVNVDGDGKSYLVIDYTNLQILKEQDTKTLNAL